MSQLMPSSLLPLCNRICLLLSSQRKTPAYSPAKETTALLNILLAEGMRLRRMIGFRRERHITPSYPSGLSSQGIFGNSKPIILVFLIAFISLSLDMFSILSAIFPSHITEPLFDGADLIE